MDATTTQTRTIHTDALPLDAVVEAFLGRPLDGGPYCYLWLDALTQKVREAGRIVNACVVIATAVQPGGAA